MTMRLLRYRILFQTAALVGLVLAAKIGLHAVGWEFIALSPLHTSIVAGGIFILSIFLAGILPDSKEAEREISEALAQWRLPRSRRIHRQAEAGTGRIDPDAVAALGGTGG